MLVEMKLLGLAWCSNDSRRMPSTPLRYIDGRSSQEQRVNAVGFLIGGRAECKRSLPGSQKNPTRPPQ